MTETQLLFPLRVTPRSGKNELLAFEPGDSTLKMRVTAPPEDGKANAAVEKCLASLLGISKSRVEIIAGDKARNKQVAVQANKTEHASLLDGLARMLQAETSAACFTVVLKSGG